MFPEAIESAGLVWPSGLSCQTEEDVSSLQKRYDKNTRLSSVFVVAKGEMATVSHLMGSLPFIGEWDLKSS